MRSLAEEGVAEGRAADGGLPGGGRATSGMTGLTEVNRGGRGATGAGPKSCSHVRGDAQGASGRGDSLSLDGTGAGELGLQGPVGSHNQPGKARI